MVARGSVRGKESLFEAVVGISPGMSHGAGPGTYTARLVALHTGGFIGMQSMDGENRTIVTVRLPVDLV